MGKIYRGTTEVSDIVRQSDISKVYRGTSEVWVRTIPFVLSGGSTSSVGSDIVHTFTSNGTLTVTGSGTVQLLIVGNGNNGGNHNPSISSGAGGNGGQVIYQATYALTAGSYPVTITGTVNFDGNSATTGGGASGGASRSTSGNGNRGSNGTSNSITGSAVVYGSGGGGGALSKETFIANYTGGPAGTGAGIGGACKSSAPATSPTWTVIGGNGVNYGAGGGGAASQNNGTDYRSIGPGTGKSGIVIVRYTPSS